MLNHKRHAQVRTVISLDADPEMMLPKGTGNTLLVNASARSPVLGTNISCRSIGSRAQYSGSRGTRDVGRAERYDSRSPRTGGGVIAVPRPDRRASQNLVDKSVYTISEHACMGGI